MFDFDLEGEESIHFLSETGDSKQWGGARQLTIFAKMEHIKIDVHSHGIQCQACDFDSNGEQKKKHHKCALV
eukprot:7589925-Heterocapsa_arctica.AAC.1